ncbi:MAG: hypothetical protein ACK4N5_14435, partial [Myxococcales bacterium]
RAAPPTPCGVRKPGTASAISTAALFDTSDAAKLTASGPDAPQFLHNISTNDVKDLPLGGGCELYFCDARARALFVAWVYHVLLADGRRDAEEDGRARAGANDGSCGGRTFAPSSTSSPRTESSEQQLQRCVQQSREPARPPGVAARLP